MMIDRFDYRNYRSLQVEGVHFAGVEALEAYCATLEQAGLDWQLHLAGFIREWISDEPTIAVKTSGSTGLPKVIRVQKRAMVASALKTIDFFNLKPNESALLCLSVGYIAGRMMVVRALVGALNLVPVEVAANPIKEGLTTIDFAAMVPSQVDAVMTENAAALNRIQKLIIGGGAIPVSLKKKLQGVSTEIWETYGMTETLSHIAVRRVNRNANTWFQCLDGVAISQDQRGCLVIKAPDICSEAIVTNDLVHMGNDRQFELLGRYDNVINTGGVKVFPETIEQKLSSCIEQPFVAIGWPDERWGQKVVLVIEGEEKKDLTHVHFSHLLDKFEQPKEVLFWSVLPRTATGKVNRPELIRLIGEAGEL